MPQWPHQKRRDAQKSKDGWIPADQLLDEWGRVSDNVVIDFIRWCNNPPLSTSNITSDVATFKAGQLAALDYFLNQIDKGRKSDGIKNKKG